MQTDELTTQSERAASDDCEQSRKPMPNITHAVIQMRIGARFSAQAGDRFLIASELTLEFTDGSTLVPDSSVLPMRKLKYALEPARCQDIPLFVVEIYSPTQGYLDLTEKCDQYFAHGIASVWLVQPAFGIIAVYRPGEDRARIFQQGEVRDPVTGLSVEIGDLFP